MLACDSAHDDLAVATGEPPKRLRIDAISAAELEALDLPQVPAVVPGFIVEGVTLLAGAPKIGKSWQVLDLALAVASGGMAFGGIQCEAGDVLYAALEDNPRRLKRRLQKLRPEGGWPQRLRLMMQMDRLDAGGLKMIEQWVRSVPRPKLIIIDTFARVRNTGRGNEQQYDVDYAAVGPLRLLADTYGLAILVVHHTRKLEADDPLDSVSGTTGLTGAADTTLVLKREGHGATLYGQGWDIEEIELGMKFDPNSGRWLVLGDAADVKRSPERARILELLMGRGEPMGPKEIALALGEEENNVRQLLLKMVGAGELQKEGRGSHLPQRKMSV